MEGKADLEITKKAMAMGWITMSQLKSCLEYQRKLQEKGESGSLSQILIRQKYITPEQLEFLKTERESREDGLGLKVGSTFAGYEIQGKLGAGGMGIVYKAMDLKLKRVVALKLLSSLDVTPEESGRFLQEASVMARLDHPHIVRLFEARDVPKHHFVMEYIDGGTLSHLIKEKEINPISAAQIIQKIADALEAAHNLGIIHRDIKPANIMVTRDGVPKLMDFGLAKLTNVENSLSHTGHVVGTPAYMSPEQANGKKVDKRSDIYSLGATIYECLTGRPPFQGESYANIVHRIMYEDVVRPRLLNPDIPEELEAITLKCLEKKSEKRYVSASQLAKDLRNFLANRPIMAKPYTWLDLVGKLVLRHKVLSGAAVAAMLILALFIVTLLYYNGKIANEKVAALKAKEQLAEEKAESEALAKAVIESLQYAYEREKHLRKDQEFLKPVRSIFQHLKRFKAGDEYRILRGLVFGVSANTEEAQKGIEDYNRILQNDPKDAVAYSTRGFLYEKQGREEEALRDYNQAITLDPKLAMARVNRGAWYGKRGRYEEAIKDFNQAVSLDPKEAQAYSNRGAVYGKQGRYEEAVGDLTRAIALDPKDTSFLSNRGILYGNLGRYEDALSDFAQAISLNPKDAQVYRGRGVVYVKQEKYEEALRDFNQAISLNPEDAQVYAHRGVVYLKQGKNEEALRDFNQAIPLNPKDAQAYADRGVVYLKQGKSEDAIRDFKQAISLDPDNAQANLGSGVFYEKRGEYEKAIAYWEKAIAQNHPKKNELKHAIQKAKEKMRKK